VTSYEQAYGWKNAEVGKELARILYDKGIVMVSWIWQAAAWPRAASRWSIRTMPRA
jgi:hypothetical protein